MTLSLLAVALAAKVALVVFRVVDGGGAGLLSGWTPLALVHEDLRLVVAFGLVAAALRTRGRLLVVGLHAALAFWIAANVPVARVMSTPMTFSFVHAAGGALGDSIAAYVTPVNLGLPLLLWAGALLASRRLERVSWSARARRAAVAPVVAVLLLGPYAAARTDTLGLNRNAVVALLETTVAHRLARAPVGPPGPAECAATDQPAGTALADLEGAAAGRNVVWVLLESTGARSLAAYGAVRAVMPHIDELASNAVVFDNAYAAYPESIKGLFSMLCSRLPPPDTEASDYTAARFPCPSLPGRLQRAGYQTALFHSGRFGYLGMDAVVQQRGFSRLEDAATIPSPHRSSFGVDDRSTARHLLAFVDGLPRGAPFFAVFAPIAGHHPYHAPGRGSRPFAEDSVRDEHDNDLHVADEAFGLLREGLRARGLDDRTVYVVAGDHGEAFGEHPGNIGHTLFLYEENVRVPLFVAAPGLTRLRRARQLASLLDLAPTTLALAGLPPEGAYQGRSLLLPLARAVRFFTEQAVRRAGLRDGRFKLLLDEDTGRAQLFDLGSDPAEHHDVAAGDPARVARYRACLDRRRG